MIVEALRMTTTDFEQPGNGNLRGFRQSRGRSHTAPFVEMINDLLSFGFPDFGVKQGGIASFREHFATLTTAQQTNPIFAIDLASREIALTWASKILAFGIDTGSSGKVGSWHGALLGSMRSVQLSTPRTRLPSDEAGCGCKKK